MPNAQEAQKLWNEMMVLERTQPGVGEDKQAFFKKKEKEMKGLREAYQKATGLPATAKATQAISQKKTERAITGQAGGNGHETSDTL
jgi:hypothetical protein